MEGVGLRAGLFDTLIRTDTQLVTKQAVTTLNGTLTFYRNLLDFDAVLLFVGGNPRLTTQQKTDLLSFVHDDGKGLVVIHSSVCAFGDWPEWKEMIGLAALPESERPGVSEEMAVRVLAPDFPPMRMFSPSFRIRDKFVHASFADSEAVRVLATAGADVPAAWTTNYGKGRVFVSQFGHDDEVWDRKDVQRMVLEAVRWVMHSQAPPSKARADKSR